LLPHLTSGFSLIEPLLLALFRGGELSSLLALAKIGSQPPRFYQKSPLTAREGVQGLQDETIRQ
jgi:hypothetical protein